LCRTRSAKFQNGSFQAARQEADLSYRPDKLDRGDGEVGPLAHRKLGVPPEVAKDFIAELM